MTETYARPDVLVSTGWVAEHLEDPAVVVVEVNTDLQAGYDQRSLTQTLQDASGSPFILDRTSHDISSLSYSMPYGFVCLVCDKWH